MKVGFIGAGKMAQALCRGFISAGITKPSEIMASDVKRSTLQEIGELGVQTTESNTEVVQSNELVYIAVKPYTVRDVVQETAPVLRDENLVVSVAAGISTDTIEQDLPEGARVIRVMPNTGSVVQSGASVYSLGRAAHEHDGKLVARMLESVGLAEEMPEGLMDAVTGLSGIGPLYGFVTIQALADGGVKMGLNRDQSTRLAAQLMMGAAKMVLSTQTHPEQLKDEVCSPGGTSIHALHKLEKAGFRGALIDAVEAGTLRSREIGLLFNGVKDKSV